MLDNLTIAQPNVDRITILNSGIVTLIEDLYREDLVLGRSRIKATFSSLQVSGLIERLYYEVYDGNLEADNVIEFDMVPSGTESVEIAGVTYTFVASGLLISPNDVPLRNTALGCAIALYRVINKNGIPGADYVLSGQNVHPYVSGLLADNPLYLQINTSGIIGNTYTIYKNYDSTALGVYSVRFSKGKDQEVKNPLWFDYVAYSGTNGTTYLCDVPSSDYGLTYYVRLYFANSSGLQALNVLQEPSDYWRYTPPFFGRTSLPYYAEVSGLVGSDLVQGKIPSIHEIVIKWDDMHVYSGLNVKLAYPLTTGTPTQSTDSYDLVELGQKFSYIIFVFKSSAGSSPQRSWPRPTDANGTWYYAGRTDDTSARVFMPIGSTYSIWVGFGNADTLRTSGLPIDIVHPDIYIE